MGIGLLTLVLLGGLLIAGLWLLVLGVRGTSVPPIEVCADCRFCLSGLNGNTCPECGSDLGRSQARRTVRRTRRPGRVWAGIAITLLALLAPGTLVVDGIASGRLTSSMPTWVLVAELRVLAAQTPERISDELLARCRRGDVAPSLWKSAAEAGIRIRQVEDALPPSLNQLIGDAAAAGYISKDEFAAHTITPFLLDVESPERVRVGDDLVLGLRNTGGSQRFPTDMSWIWCRRIVSVEVDGVVQPMRQPPDEEVRQRWAHALRYSPNTVYGTAHPQPDLTIACVPAVVATTSGDRRVRVTFEVSVYNGPLDSSPGRARTTREFSVAVLPAGAQLVALSDSERSSRR